MAQAPTKPGIPPDPNAGKNIHGQPNPPPPPDEPRQPHPATREQVNLHGQPPQPNMAPPVAAQSGLGDNTRAEMEAGRANLAQYNRRDTAEHEAGRRALEQRADRTNPRE